MTRPCCAQRRLRRPPRPSQYLAGFTLVEMLVTIVILAMISSVLWQAMQQIVRIEQIMQSSGAQAQMQLVRREWLRGLIAAALPELQNTGPQFRGDATELQLASAEAIDLPGVGAGALRIRLFHDARTESNEVRAGMAPKKGSGLVEETTAPSVLLRWVGPAATFKYLDANGQWQAAWPPLDPGSVGLSRLPKAVRVDLGDAAGGVLMATIGANELPRARRVDWERQ